MNRLTRRTVLKSSAATLLLPLLESNGFSAANQAAGGVAPRRLVFLAMGYGVHPETWFPDTTQIGTNYELSSSLKPFEPVKKDISVIQNLTNQYYVNGHTGSTTFLTSANPRAKSGVAFSNTVSCDQLAADTLGRDTRHQSLAISGYDGVNDGHGGGAFGYMSWGHNGKPVGVYRKLTDLYAALFGAEGVSADTIHATLARKKSSLDALHQNAKSLNHKVSQSDRNRIDEYFTSIRSIENRLSKAQDWVDRPYPKAPFELTPDIAAYSGSKMIELTFDLMLTAIQSDSTRVLSYLMPSTNLIKELKAPITSHNMSHHGNKPDWVEVQRKRDHAFSELVAGFLIKLKNTKEFDGSSLLDHSLIAYGSTLRRGHGQRNGPMILAGHGGGGLKQGQNLVYKADETPLSNLWLSMLRHVGIEQDQFADSKRVLSEVGFS